ncbi:MAG: response regulator transcription factor [Sandarakinorhabdus sp.]|nr:response regulator transcription factor [Sandarakinorhabdus sp.]
MQGRPTVYVVDDDASVRASASFFLPTIGYAAHSFESGGAFLDMLPALVPGCLLLDIRMPEIDGFQVIEALASRRRQFPIIVITGHGDVVTAVQAMKMGALDFIEKPFEEMMLLAMLQRVFESLETALSSEEARAVAAKQLERLTAREIDVLRGLVDGRSNKVLAYDLGLSVRTVEMHRANMMDRLKLSTLADVLRLAFEAGFTPRQQSGQPL